MYHRTPIEFRAAASPALLQRGCVNVISLAPIIRKAGACWPRIRDGVCARLENLLRQKLGATDFFARLSEHSYLVTMPAADSEDVNVVCLRVAYDLYTSFLGQCRVGDIIVCDAFDAGKDLLLLMPLPPERIVLLADKAGIREFAPTGMEKPAVLSPRGGKAASPLLSENATLDLDYQYLPVWSPANAAITTYLCEAKAIKSSAMPQQWLSLNQLSGRERIKLELSCLFDSVSRLAKASQQGDRFLLGVTVSFNVVGSPAGRMEFLSALRALSAEYRQSLDFTLTEVPPGVAQTRLNNLVNTLRPFARSVSATLAPGTRDGDAYQGLGLRAIGLNMDEFQNGRELLPEDGLGLARMAKASKLGTFLYGVRNINELKIVRAAEIQQLSGPAIAAPCEEPRAMRRLTWQEVLADKYAAV